MNDIRKIRANSKSTVSREDAKKAAMKGENMKEELFWEPTQVKNCKLPLVLKTILPEGCDQLLLQKSDMDWLIDLDRGIKALVGAIEKHWQVRIMLRQVEE